MAWEIDENLPPIMGDPGRLEQVMINLLLNARDAIEQKCASDLDPQTDKVIRLITALRGNRVLVKVCDTGGGIPDPIVDKIFEPFFTTKKVGEGTGLGLSISYGIVKECDGKIYARPNPGGGTCFVMEFPICLEER